MTKRWHWILLCIFASLCLSVYAQPSEVASTVVLKTQVASIAEEIVTKNKIVFGDSITVELKIEGGLHQTLTENAFTDALNRLGCRVMVGTKETRPTNSLQALVLEQNVRYSEKTASGFERKTRTVLEARYQRGADGGVQYLGVFTRESVDTVLQRDELALPALNHESSKENSVSFFDRIAGPALIITGAFLIVYLFFTVRN